MPCSVSASPAGAIEQRSIDSYSSAVDDCVARYETAWIVVWDVVIEVVVLEVPSTLSVAC